MLRLSLLLAVTLLAFGCGKEIGDECLSDSECGPSRSCDKASTGGYCTVTPCTAGTCPEGAVCVTFVSNDTYCMAACESDDDCRDGYRCTRDDASTPYCRQSQ